MRQTIKKFVLMAVAFAAVVGIIVGQNKSVYADDEKIVKVHYLRSDAAYENYMICIWDEGNQGIDYPLVVEGNEGTVTYTCSSTSAEQVNFVIKTNNNAEMEINTNRLIDVSEVSSGTVDVYVKSGVQDITLEGFDTIPDANNNAVDTTQETTVASEETTVASVNYSASDKDFSVNAGTVIVVDIITLLVIALGSFVIFNKKENK